MGVKEEEVNNDVAEGSFVVAYFCDQNPWDMYRIGHDSCIALTLWMQTAKELVQKCENIQMLVHPDVLKVINPDMGKEKEVMNGNGNVDGNDEKEIEEEDDDSSDSMPSPPP